VASQSKNDQRVKKSGKSELSEPDTATKLPLKTGLKVLSYESVDGEMGEVGAGNGMGKALTVLPAQMTSEQQGTAGPGLAEFENNTKKGGTGKLNNRLRSGGDPTSMIVRKKNRSAAVCITQEKQLLPKRGGGRNNREKKSKKKNGA